MIAPTAPKSVWEQSILEIQSITNILKQDPKIIKIIKNAILIQLKQVQPFLFSCDLDLERIVLNIRNYLRGNPNMQLVENSIGPIHIKPIILNILNKNYNDVNVYIDSTQVLSFSCRETYFSMTKSFLSTIVFSLFCPKRSQ